MNGHLSVFAPDGLPEVRADDDLAALLLAFVDLADGDVLVITSKVVSKAEGRVRDGHRDEALAEETLRVVARREPMRIVRNRLGLTMAAGGIDASNVEAGRFVLLPLDPDASARRIRAAVLGRVGVNVGVVITDTAGRAWREGQTDIAVGAAGIRVVEDFAGRTDSYGNDLAVTAPAVADELAGAAELAQGKLSSRPVAVVRGRADLVLTPGEQGPGASALIRPEGGDLFGYGAREAVIRALAGDPDDREPFGAPAVAAELLAALDVVCGPASAGLHPQGGIAVSARTDPAVLAALAFAHGWTAEPSSATTTRMFPATP